MKARRDECCSRTRTMSAPCRVVFQLRTYRCIAVNCRFGPIGDIITFDRLPRSCGRSGPLPSPITNLAWAGSLAAI